MRILFLAHRIPYPPNKGDKIRSFNEIKYLSKNHEIDLACLADDPNDLKYQMDLKAYCRKVYVAPLNKTVAKIKGVLNLLAGGSISAGHFYKKKLQIVVDRWLESTNYSAIVCFSSPMAEYIFHSKASNITTAQRPTLIMDFCDLDSDKWCQYADSSAIPLNLIYRLEAKRLLAYEKKVNLAFDHSLFVTKQESNLFKRLYPQVKNLTIIPNGVDHNYFSPNHSADSLRPGTKGECELNECTKTNKTNPTNNPSKPVLLFAGAMDYNANEDGVIWFCNEILPLIKHEHPRSVFFIVGSNPTSAVRHLGELNNVVVTGFVDDIRPYYNIADVCVIPLRLARGIQNKVLESMAMAKPVVATSKAVEGLSAQNQHDLLVADSHKAFALRVCELLNDESRRIEMGQNARERVTKDFGWENNIQKFEKILLPHMP